MSQLLWATVLAMHIWLGTRRRRICDLVANSDQGREYACTADIGLQPQAVTQVSLPHDGGSRSPRPCRGLCESFT